MKPLPIILLLAVVMCGCAPLVETKSETEYLRFKVNELESELSSIKRDYSDLYMRVGWIETNLNIDQLSRYWIVLTPKKSKIDLLGEKMGYKWETETKTEGWTNAKKD